MTTLQAATTGTVSGLANNQQLNIVAGNLSTMIQGATAPTTTTTGLASTAGVWWHDTGNKIIFIRDQADASWLPVFYLNETGHLIGTSGQAGAWVTVTGTGNAIILTYPVAPAAFVQGMKFAFKAPAANTSTTTVTINSVTKNVFKKGAAGAIACAGGEIQIGDLVELEFDGTQLQIISGLPGGVTAVSDATNGGINVATGTSTPVLSLKPSDLLTKTTPTTSDSVVIQDAAASNAAKTSTLAQLQTALVLPRVIVQDRKATTTAGAALTQNAYTDHDLQTIILNTVGGATAIVTTLNLRLPPGTYDVTAFAAFNSTGGSALTRLRLFNTTDGVVQVDTNSNDVVNVNPNIASNQPPGALRARFTLAAQKDLKFQQWNNNAGNSQGAASSGTGNTEPEVYLSAEFVKVA